MRKEVIRIAVVVLVTAFVSWIITGAVANLSEDNPLPQNLDIAYKEIQLGGVPAIERYALIDTAGRNYFVIESIFNTTLAPQKIGDCLYRMPDGSLLTCLPSEEGKQ